MLDISVTNVCDFCFAKAAFPVLNFAEQVFNINVAKDIIIELEDGIAFNILSTQSRCFGYTLARQYRGYKHTMLLFELNHTAYLFFLFL
jgi:hypothetical protein